MKKHLKLCGEYLGSVRSNSVALCCVLSIAFTMIALLLGSYNYTYSRYLKFKSAEDDADGVYFMCTSIKPDDREALLNTINEHPSVDAFAASAVKYRYDDSLDLRFIDEDYDKVFGEETLIGGFDYSSGELEIILPFSYLGRYWIGDEYKLVFEEAIKETLEDGTLVAKDLVVELTVCGFSSPSALFADMSGGGTSTTVDLMIDDLGECALIKYDQGAAQAFAVITESADGKRSTLKGAITFKSAATSEQKQELKSILTECGVVNTFDEILENSKQSLDDSVSKFIPFTVFLVIFSLITLVSIIALSVYRRASDYAVWYLVGADRKKIISVVVSSFSLLTVLSALISCALLLLSALPKVAEKLEFLESVRVDLKLLAVEIAFVLISLAVTTVVCRLAVKDNDPRKMMDRYRD